MAKSEAIRVLMLVENCSYPRDMRVRREAEALTGAGYKVSVISPALPDQPRSETIGGVAVYRYRTPAQPRGQIGYLWEYGYSLAATFVLALRVYARQGIDVIHAANPPDLFVLIGLLFKCAGVRFVYDQHDLVPEMYLARYQGAGRWALELALRACEKCSYLVADHVIVSNASYRDNAIERGKVRPEHVTIVRNGPDRALLEYHGEPISGLARDGDKVIAYLGFMGSQDGVENLIRALRHLRDDLGRSDFICILCGTGEELPKLEVLAQMFSLEQHVRFMGFVPDPEYMSYLLAADICVDPDPFSEYNDRSTMVKVMDYMAAAKPIVSFDLAETRRSAGGAALYAKPNDEMEFAKAIMKLMDNPDRRRAMGTIGRRRVESELSWSRSAQGLLRAYSDLCHYSRASDKVASAAPLDCEFQAGIHRVDRRWRTERLKK